MISLTPEASSTDPLLPVGRPCIVGVVNLTEDSFSDGGRFLDPQLALAHARFLQAEGASVIELGPAASHPGSKPVSAAEERRRLAPVLERLVADGAVVAVDSFRSETLRYAASAGAAYLNDIHGFGDPALYPVLAASHCSLIVMHAVQAVGTATHLVTDPLSVWEGIHQFFDRRLSALQAAGIARNRLIIDPGLGYFLGSTPAPSLTALAGIRELKATFRLPVLVSPSRKSFLRNVTGRDIDRSGPATLAAEIFAAWQGADYLRTHDVAATRDALTLLAAIAEEASRLPTSGSSRRPPAKMAHQSQCSTPSRTFPPVGPLLRMTSAPGSDVTPSATMVQQRASHQGRARAEGFSLVVTRSCALHLDSGPRRHRTRNYWRRRTACRLGRHTGGQIAEPGPR